MYQRIFAVFFFIIFIIISIFGMMHWNTGIDAISNSDSVEKGTNSNEKLAPQSHASKEQSFESLKENIANLPDSIQHIFKEAYVNEEKVKLLIVGSPSIGANSDGWSVLVKDELEKIYGRDFVEVAIHEFDGTSSEFVESDVAEQIINEQADIILLESFSLEDNIGLVSVDSSLDNLETFLDTLKETNPKVGVIIQPPNPLHQARNYPKQVDTLQEFVEEKVIPYFNHWNNWPDPDGDEIQEYLNEESLPNEIGHELWAEAVLEYFANK